MAKSLRVLVCIVLVLVSVGCSSGAPKDVEVAIREFIPSADGVQLELVALVGHGQKPRSVEVVADSSTAVKVSMVCTGFHNPGTAELLTVRKDLTLAEPLGNRTLIDASTGKNIPRGVG